MVAYQGDVRFEHKGGGLGRSSRRAVTGEGVKLMAANGTGDLFLAMDKRKIMILELHNERMTVNGDNILAFEPGIEWDIKRVEARAGLAGGLFNVVLEGSGKVAVTSDGEPVLLDTSTPTFADPESAIAWSGGVRTGVGVMSPSRPFTGRQRVVRYLSGGRLGPNTTLGRRCRSRAFPRRRWWRRAGLLVRGLAAPHRRKVARYTRWRISYVQWTPLW